MPETVSHNMLIATEDNATARATLKVLAEMGVRGSVVGSMALAKEKADSSASSITILSFEANPAFECARQTAL